MSRKIAVLFMLAAAPLSAQTSTAVISINGAPILQSEVIQRLWSLHGTVVLDQMIDEKLIRQEAERLKVTANEKELESRLSRIRQQFQDAKAFEEQLKKAGTTLDAVKEQIRFQLLTEATVAKARQITLAKDEVKSFFEQNKDKLASPESVRLRHLLVKNRQEADDIIIALDAGADFSKLAAQKSLDEATRAKGGDMGYVTKGIMAPEVEKVVFGLKKGQHSPVISTSVGFHILQVDDVKQPQPADFKKIQEDLRLALYNNKISQALPELLKELRAKARIEYPAAAPADRK